MLATEKSIFVIHHFPGNTGGDVVSIWREKDSGKGFQKLLKKNLVLLSQNSFLVAHKARKENFRSSAYYVI